MSIRFRILTPLVAAVGMAGAVLLAVPASAQPTCVDTAPRTTLCSTNGSSSLTTSPPPMNNWPWYGGGFGFGGFVIGLG
ncbi:hypothetical protein [Mycolicibacterium lacusdiani]|uniref:hypothetical protein n=1 Tax=Mycolicibacterium lacusdiani TaxID=2895283 RepID=UPI001F2553B1|nr:hypothetical protein [Mycolicibacterium lacusdiani]